ncbi:GNAT family N-acetyltransferase [Bacillus alkalicellulosilyticus]|uniref:GNAT family N-acetyltransferase n=1 Tax=Alkalihalobacterium alkalicellulosilyticum TaxID=1912214 RepID=UPI003183CED9
MVIRDAIKGELPFIRKQRVLAYQEYSSFISNSHWNGLKQIISSDSDEKPGVEVIVCELDGKIVGSVALFPPEKEAYEGKVDELHYPEIRLLAVDPNVRGKGVASKLIN